MRTPKRLHWIDIARGVCIIAIVIGHTLRNSVLRTYLLSFDVPMFFFLAGYCYRHPVSKLEYIKKKVRTIVIPYIVFSLASIFAFAIAGRIIPQVNSIMNCSVLNNLLVMLYGNSKPDIMKYNSPLWFLPCFFVVSILGCLLESILRIVRRQSTLRAGVIVLLILMGGYFCQEIMLPWHIETAVSMLVWYELGILVKEKIGDVEKICGKVAAIKRLALLIAIFIIGSTVTYVNFDLIKTSLQVRLDVYGNYILYYIAAMSGIIVFCGLSQWISENKILEFIGRNSMAILVMHKFPVLFFQELLPVTTGALEQSNSFIGIVTGLLVAAVSVIVSLAIGELLKKMAPWSIGISNGPAPP